MGVRLHRRWALALLAVIALAAALPDGALANGPGNPFSPGLPAQSQTVPTTTTPTILTTNAGTSTSSNGLSGGSAIAIAVGAVVVLSGISFFIWRDARRRAPVRQHAAHATAGVGGRSGSKARPKPRKPSIAERRRRKRGRAR